MSDSLRQLASLADDDETKTLVGELLAEVLRQAIRDMRVGSQATRALITRTLLPVVAKSLTGSEGEDALAPIRAELVELHRVLGGGGGGRDDDGHDDG